MYISWQAKLRCCELNCWVVITFDSDKLCEHLLKCFKICQTSEPQSSVPPLCVNGA